MNATNGTNALAITFPTTCLHAASYSRQNGGTASTITSRSTMSVALYGNVQTGGELTYICAGW